MTLRFAIVIKPFKRQIALKGNIMHICTKISEVRNIVNQVRLSGKIVGLVPTMGALHEGHASLIRAAAAETDFVVVTIFVNPTQFGPTEDLAAYPRTFQADCHLAESLGAQLVFAPEVDEMYPKGATTWVEVEGQLTSILCARSRPTHFRGVTTVVAKLFNIVGPCQAYFGQKDAQQAQIIRRMIEDLILPVTIKIMPIIREDDGLALSSRNAYLTADERKAALVLSKTLARARQALTKDSSNGAELSNHEVLSLLKGDWQKSLTVDEEPRSPAELLALVKSSIEAEPLAKLDYAEIYSFPDFADLTPGYKGRAIIALAVKFGGARLIDNLVVDF